MPDSALGRVVQPASNVVRQFQGLLQPSDAFGRVIPGDAMADGRVDIVVGVVLEQTPYSPVGAIRNWTFGLRHFQQAGNHRVARDVAGDVLLQVTQIGTTA